MQWLSKHGRYLNKVAKLSEEHTWFAWYPVRDKITEKTIWLETVTRRMILGACESHIFLYFANRPANAGTTKKE